MHGARGNLSIKPRLYLGENGSAIGLIPQAKNREQHSLLEISENVSHKAYNVSFERECQADRKSPAQRKSDRCNFVRVGTTPRRFQEPYFSVRIEM